jgi:hypothetical protein
MKLAEHVEHIRQLIDKAFRNRLGRMGITLKWAENNLHEAVNSNSFPNLQIPETDELSNDLKRIIDILNTFEKETGSIADAFEKLVEELTFTLFNRIAALKVMEAHALHPEIITRQSQHGDRSFSHFLWLEQNPEGRIEENEGLLRFLEDQLTILSGDIPLFSPSHPYHLLPTAIELNSIINAFNKVETDEQVEPEIWESDDVLGWLYESFNNYKKTAHKESGEKTEYNKVSIQSQVYTPRWVVKFLVDNSLGKLYLEMYPDSAIKEKYKIANAPKTRTREIKPLTEIRMIDLATGSGNFVLYGFDLFYDLYLDQIDNYGADYNESKLPEIIISNNLYGIDLDDRAVQLAQLGLYVKAKRIKRSAKISHFNVVSSDFFLPDYKEVKHLFENGEPLSTELEKIVVDLWFDLQQAHKFGSLIRLEEKFSFRLHGLVQEFEKTQLRLFSNESLASYEQFKENFLKTLKKAVAQNAAKQGITMLNTKTQDAITFLELLTKKYDLAVANPPYTDITDYGPELKKFVEANYKQPYKFNTNLYVSFVKRCCEIIYEKGKLAMVHPPTFMYIKTFEDVRKFVIEKMHISFFVEWGYLGMFNPLARVDSAMYILEKEQKTVESQFIKLNDIYEGKRYDAFVRAYNDILENRPNQHNFTLPQSKLKIIEGYPFIYWISDGFREKFKEKLTKQILDNCQGMATTNNNRFVRFWWEVNPDNISSNYKVDGKKWVPYIKGGPFKKWYGNLWCVVNYFNSGKELIEVVRNKYPKISDPEFVIKNRRFYFQSGINYSASGSKGATFRFHPENYIFDVGGASIFPTFSYKNLYYILAFFNTKLCAYIINCLNPTVNTQSGDIERVPFIIPNLKIENLISELSKINVELNVNLCSFSIVESNYKRNPLYVFSDISLKDRVQSYLNFENLQLAIVLLNEAIINKLIYEVYELSDEDRLQVEVKMGVSVGSKEISSGTFDIWRLLTNEELGINSEIRSILDNYIRELPRINFEEDRKREIIAEMATLYQGNNDLEELCIRMQINPLELCFWFSQNKIYPQARASEIALEFLADAIRSILMEDLDGIIPLVGLPDEPRLLDRLEHYCLNQGFTQAQFMQLDGLLGRPLNEYIEHYFFRDLSAHLNLFMHLPKTPFIWHLSSGEHQGFEAFIIIYKWNRDSLFKLKSQYISHRVQNLEYRQIQLQNTDTAQAQNEKEKIRLQLNEIEIFKTKIDELIAEGYNPILDDGVGKNIAPLQKKGLLRAEVLKSAGKNSQLEKYLNADW